MNPYRTRNIIRLAKIVALLIPAAIVVVTVYWWIFTGNNLLPSGEDGVMLAFLLAAVPTVMAAYIIIET